MGSSPEIQAPKQKKLRPTYTKAEAPKEVSNVFGTANIERINPPTDAVPDVRPTRDISSFDPQSMINQQRAENQRVADYNQQAANAQNIQGAFGQTRTLDGGNLTYGLGAENQAALDAARQQSQALNQQYGSFIDNPQPGFDQSAADTFYNVQADRLNPQFDRAEDRLRNQLANQGFSQESEAYRQALDDLRQSQGDQLNQLSLGAMQYGDQRALANQQASLAALGAASSRVDPTVQNALFQSAQDTTRFAGGLQGVDVSSPYQQQFQNQLGLDDRLRQDQLQNYQLGPMQQYAADRDYQQMMLDQLRYTDAINAQNVGALNAYNQNEAARQQQSNQFRQTGQMQQWQQAANLAAQNAKMEADANAGLWDGIGGLAGIGLKGWFGGF